MIHIHEDKNQFEIEIDCPSCSPNKNVWHRILNSNRNKVVKCINCSYIHTISNEKLKFRLVKVIISNDKNTKVIYSNFNTEETIYIGKDFIVEDHEGNNIYSVRITSIETKNKRVLNSKILDTDAIWCRSIDKIKLKVSYHENDKTNTAILFVDGNVPYYIGENIKIQDRIYSIIGIKKRKGKYYKKENSSIYAKDISRLFIK